MAICYFYATNSFTLEIWMTKRTVCKQPYQWKTTYLNSFFFRMPLNWRVFCCFERNCLSITQCTLFSSDIGTIWVQKKKNSNNYEIQTKLTWPISWHPPSWNSWLPEDTWHLLHYVSTWSRLRSLPLNISNGEGLTLGELCCSMLRSFAFCHFLRYVGRTRRIGRVESMAAAFSSKILIVSLLNVHMLFLHLSL